MYNYAQVKSVILYAAGADPGFLDRGFKLAEGVRFVQFDQFFLKFRGITTYRNGPEWTETDLQKYRNGLLWVPKRTGTDFSGYRNGPGQTQLTYPHCSRASLLGSLPVSLVHILSPVTDNCPFLNQRKGGNGLNFFFMTLLLPRMCAGSEDGIRDRPHTRRTRVRPSFHARQRNLKVGELFMQQNG